MTQPNPLSLTPASLSDLYDHPNGSVIDVRSPAEFAEDHLPGAINLPVLSDAQRAQVGTIYKQDCPFAARKIGAAQVFSNTAEHIKGPLACKPGGWKPLVYCWRGGQRSGSFAWLLAQIGWQTTLLTGGYKTYRRLIIHKLYESALPFRLVLLDGYTGTAKTDLLPLLAAQNVQVLDLEALAHHRGSLLGGFMQGQPSQKAFETALALALHQLDPSRPVLVEAESSKIGQINLPPSLWAIMKSAPRIEISAPLEARATYLEQAYSDILADSPALRDRLSPLRYHRGHALVDHWESLIETGQKHALCMSLAKDHYDPAYNSSMHAISPRYIARLTTSELTSTALARLAERISQIMQLWAVR